MNLWNYCEDSFVNLFIIVIGGFFCLKKYNQWKEYGNSNTIKKGLVVFISLGVLVFVSNLSFYFLFPEHIVVAKSVFHYITFCLLILLIVFGNKYFVRSDRSVRSTTLVRQTLSLPTVVFTVFSVVVLGIAFVVGKSQIIFDEDASLIFIILLIVSVLLLVRGKYKGANTMLFVLGVISLLLSVSLLGIISFEFVSRSVAWVFIGSVLVYSLVGNLKNTDVSQR